MTAREEILARVRNALGQRPPGGPEAREPSYRRAGELSRAELLERLEERLRDYGVTVRRVSSQEIGSQIAASLERQAVARIVAPKDTPLDWREGSPEVEWLFDDDSKDGPLSASQVDGSDGVVTGCALAVAETGTLVLDGGSRQGRRLLSLVPDYHLCVVEEEQIVELVPEAVSLLKVAAREGRPITLISGPSATSDIELNRVEGVHGPRTLEVLLVTPGP